MENTSFKGNEAISGAACGAGIVAQTKVPLQFRNRIVFQDNLSSRDGGGVCLSPAPESGMIACHFSQQIYPFILQVGAIITWMYRLHVLL